MKFYKALMAVTAALLLASCSNNSYETVQGDPMGTRIYTLSNGLKVYMTVNKETPRIQTYIAVRSGGKNDPSDNTGLAHYLEHLMFKGTENFGTSDYASEKVILDQIEALYEVYRTKTDPEERTALYHQIDSLSYAASLIAIPNEYDKLMSVIGASGTNAFTSNDVTCYQEDIPANQVENWAKIQSDRFKNMVIRGFHTELEAVYEEYNMYLNEDGENAMEAADAALFRKHPYGLQTVIGTQQHLKNPSITAIKKQKATYYVPNNCAICVSGDIDPKSFIKTVEKYFGDWQPNPELPEFTYEPEEPITSPVELTVTGTEAEFVFMAWRTPGEKDAESEISTIVSSILANGSCGLLDLDINQQQKALGAGAMPYNRVDYGEMILEGFPKEGQSLEEVRSLLLQEVAKLRAGEFSDSLIEATYNNLKLREMQSLTQNRSRAMKYVDSFINGTSWKDEVTKLDRLSKVTRQDVMDWAEKYLAENSCVTVYKRLGINEKATQKVEAPKITPIATNRDMQSAYLTEIQGTEVPPVEPVFTDFSKDMSKFTSQGLEVLYKKNVQNDIAEISFVFDEGLLTNPALQYASTYVDYLGTEEMSAEDIASTMYSLACSSSIRVTANQTVISVSGLSENIGKALDTMTALWTGAVAEEDILEGVKFDEFKNRFDSKHNQRACTSALSNYVTYGPDYISRTTLSNKALSELSSEQLLGSLAGLLGKQHTVLYYGPQSEKEVSALLESSHRIEGTLEPVSKVYAEKLTTPEAKVYVADYDSRQINYIQYSNRGETYEPADDAAISLFNNYFGSGMNTIVFQEMREARALAYSAGALLASPAHLADNYSFIARIGTQNDKLRQAVEAFDLIINDMPESDKAFEIAKTSMVTNLRTARTTGAKVLTSYLRAKELGLSESREKAVFEAVQDMELKDLKATQQKWVKDRTYVYAILGDIKDLDMDFLKTLGPVQVVSLEEVFGY